MINNKDKSNQDSYNDFPKIDNNQKDQSSKIVKITFTIDHCHIQLYHHVKMYEKHE